MGEPDDLEIKRKFIRAYFDDFSRKIANVKKIWQMGMPEEAITLACCYIEAIANVRYGGKRKRDNFGRLLFEHSPKSHTFRKISIRDLYRRGKDADDKTQDGQPLRNYAEIVAVLNSRFGVVPDTKDEIPKAEMIAVLQAELSGLDLHNLDANLDRFSYAAVLYEQYRSPGVHSGGMARFFEAQSGAPVFPLGASGEPIYYSDERLEFSVSAIIFSLQDVHAALEAECINKLKFPDQL